MSKVKRSGSNTERIQWNASVNSTDDAYLNAVFNMVKNDSKGTVKSKRDFLMFLARSYCGRSSMPIENILNTCAETQKASIDCANELFDDMMKLLQNFNSKMEEINIRTTANGKRIGMELGMVESTDGNQPEAEES